jgi:hypothetical protein
MPSGRGKTTPGTEKGPLLNVGMQERREGFEGKHITPLGLKAQIQ